ncbi:MAG: tetratricopeptide repeat protein [Limnospira sp. PMC 1286.21]|uniref:tetratricopeptide repeat protein n=1 Tax=unclassified Limnospira TaxID=2642885 RepID=UPI0028E11508|nr:MULTISPECIES: tetratricopeptide repeat protein [unclassified Limnospira]MDT9302657.1 tetratricopeptide repeat protein [Limnospira sp. PMC 1281.21]MDT9322605.1 tetratricopeptide repeat protein [Limnospira sp. PMC 1290.21]MDT9327732.1 tetratricopeptide repeat protein [Limnospira sp. PMC 1286.21]
MNSSFQQANQWRRVGCLEEAVIAYQKAIQSHPNFYWAYQKLEETLHQLGRWDAAVTAFRHAIAVNPTARWSYFYLGQVLAQQEEWSEAIAYYQKAIAFPQFHCSIA